MKKKTTDQFIAEATKIHKGIYDYSGTVYVRSSEKVGVSCKTHGRFYVEANSHLKGVGCAKCFATRQRNRPRLGLRSTREQFLKHCTTVHGDKYIYDRTDFVTYKTPVTVTCMQHGDFTICPTNLTYGRQWCGSCAETGFTPSKSGTLYVLRAGDVIKVGITNNSAVARAKRVSKSSGIRFEVFHEIKDTGYKVYELEQRAIKWMQSVGAPMIEKFEGYTECFTQIPLDTLVENITTYHKEIE